MATTISSKSPAATPLVENPEEVIDTVMRSLISRVQYQRGQILDILADWDLFEKAKVTTGKEARHLMTYGMPCAANPDPVEVGKTVALWVKMVDIEFKDFNSLKEFQKLFTYTLMRLHPNAPEDVKVDNTAENLVPFTQETLNEWWDNTPMGTTPDMEARAILQSWRQTQIQTLADNYRAAADEQGNPPFGPGP